LGRCQFHQTIISQIVCQYTEEMVSRLLHLRTRYISQGEEYQIICSFCLSTLSVNSERRHCTSSQVYEDLTVLDDRDEPTSKMERTIV
jgi:hypothetical protein